MSDSLKEKNNIIDGGTVINSYNQDSNQSQLSSNEEFNYLEQYATSIHKPYSTLKPTNFNDYDLQSQKLKDILNPNNIEDNSNSNKYLLETYNFTNNLGHYNRIKTLPNYKHREMTEIIKKNNMPISQSHINKINNKLYDSSFVNNLKDKLNNNNKIKYLELYDIINNIKPGYIIENIIKIIDNKLDTDGYNSNLIELIKIIESRNKKIKDTIIRLILNEITD